LTLVLAVAQVTAVPVWNAAVEQTHAEDVEASLVAVDEAAVRAAAAGDVSRISLRVGMDYPTRGPFYNPHGPAGDARLAAPADVVVSNARGVDPAVARYWDGRDRRYEHRTLAVATAYNYLPDDPTVVAEGSLAYDRRVTGTDVRYDVDRFAVVSDRRVTLVTLTGEFSAVGRSDATLDVRPISAGGTPVPVTNAVAGQPVVLKVPTGLPVAVWNELLVDEFAPAGNVLGPVTEEPVAGRADVHYAVVRLAPDRVYEVDASLVGVNAGARQTLLPAYAVDVAGNRTSVQTDGRAGVVVEVRDALDNPVADARVRASGPVLAPEGATIRGRTSGTDTAVTGPDGRARFVYAAPPGGSLSRLATEAFDLTVLGPVDPTATSASRTVPFRLCVIDTDADRGGCSLAPASPTGGPGPTDTSPPTDPDVTTPPVFDPGFAYEDFDFDERYDPAGDVAIPNQVIRAGVYHVPTGNDSVLVVPPSVGDIAAEKVDFSGKGVSLYVDVTATGNTKHNGVSIAGEGRAVRLHGVTATATSQHAPVEIVDSGTVTLLSSELVAVGDVFVEAETIDARGATLTGTKNGVPGEITLSSTTGDVDAAGATLTDVGAITVDAAGDVDLTDATITTSKNGQPGPITVVAAGAIVAQDLLVDATSAVDFDAATADLQGATITVAQNNAAFTLDATGRADLTEAAVTVLKDDLTITAGSVVTLERATLDASARNVVVVVPAGTTVLVTDLVVDDKNDTLTATGATVVGTPAN
jgi:hypothetical protein